MDNFDLKKYLAEGKLLKEELTWYVEDENEDIRFQNDEYLKEVGKKIKEIHPDISSEDLNKIIIMTGEQYSREEDFHGDSIPSGNFVKAAVEIYQTDVLGSGGDKDDEDFDRWDPSNLDGDFPKDSIFAGWTQAQYDAYQEEPRKYEKYLGGGSFELAEGSSLKEELYDFVRDIKRALGTGNSPQTVINYLGRRLSKSEYAALASAGVIRGRY